MLTLLLSLATLAQAADFTDPGTLKANMEEMGKRFRLVLRQAADPTLNPKTAELANEMAQFARYSQVHLPEQVESAPESLERTIQIARFRELLGQLYTMLTQSEIALLQNKNPEAKELLKKAAELQKSGHGEFKPPREGEPQ